MMRNKAFLLFTLQLIFVFLPVRGGELQIIATCDIHGKMQNFSKLATVIRQYPNAVKIDLGDLFHGDPLNDKLNGTAMIDALNLLKYEIFIPGNHEFELPPETLSGTLNRFKGQIAGQFRMPGVKSANWILIRRPGFSCAVIGMTDHGLFRDRRFYPFMEIIDELTALDQALAEIRKLDVDAIVLARHGGNYFSGVPTGMVLYRHPEIDLIICGHTHKEIAGLRKGRCLIVQPGAFASSAILVTLQKNPRNPVLIRSRLLRPGTGYDRQISSLYFRESRRMAEQLATPVTADPRRDSLPEQIMEAMKKSAAAEAAVLELPELPAEKLHYRKFLTLFPYRNNLAVIETTPAEYLKLRKERSSRLRRRYFTPPPEGKSAFNLVLNTFILSRSKVFPPERKFRILPVIERDLILKEFQR